MAREVEQDGSAHEGQRGGPFAYLGAKCDDGALATVLSETRARHTAHQYDVLQDRSPGA